MSSKERYSNIELLAPAGSFETFRAVIHAGADAVYLGGDRFGARAYANNFTAQEVLFAIDYAHIHGRKVYLTVNTLLKESEIQEELCDYLLPYYKQGLDAVILQDMGAFSLIREVFPNLSIHTSTQMTVTNRYGAAMMKELGADRIVTAREMSLEEIRDIKEHVEIEIESFVHGALCYCYSGQCLFSSMLGGRSGNRGRCAQPCRLSYDVSGMSSYILSPKDLCTISMIPKLIEHGVNSFKIEGRMKQAEYAAGVVSIYRKYLNAYLEACLKLGAAAAEQQFQVSKEDMQKLYDFGNRSGFTDGYYQRHNGKDMITFQKPSHTKSNEALWGQIKECYVRTELKEKINGRLILKKNNPARLEVTCKEARITAEGEIVQQACRQPLTREKVSGNIQKTGNTPYVFETLQIEMEPDSFLPVQALNALRRMALEMLTEALTMPARRTIETKTATERTSPKNSCETSALAVSVEERKRIRLLCETAYVDAIYLDSSCYTRKDFYVKLKEDVHTIQAYGKKAYYIMPAVFRLNTLSFYEKQEACLHDAGLDGMIVKSYDALAFIQEKFPELPVIIDHNLYTWNSYAIRQFHKFQNLRDTVPFELNRKELFQRENQTSEMILYGNLPLMTSAQCVHANTKGCDKMPQITYLKDRYGKYFPVKNNCTECYNTIYNSAPLILFQYREELEKMGLYAYRLSFTTETQKQMRQILQLYEKVFLNREKGFKDLYEGEYTAGHYKRGVE